MIAVRVEPVTTHGGGVADTETHTAGRLRGGHGGGGLIADARGNTPAGVEEVLADKGHHSTTGCCGTCARWRCGTTWPTPSVGRKYEGGGRGKEVVNAKRADWECTRQAFAGRARGTDRTQSCTSVRYRRRGPAVCPRTKQRSEKAAAAARPDRCRRPPRRYRDAGTIHSPESGSGSDPIALADGAQRIRRSAAWTSKGSLVANPTCACTSWTQGRTRCLDVGAASGW